MAFVIFVTKIYLLAVALFHEAGWTSLGALILLALFFVVSFPNAVEKTQPAVSVSEW